MGFFSNIKNRARQQASSPVRPNPGNMGGNLGSDFRMPQKPSGLGGLLPQQNLDFLSIKSHLTVGDVIHPTNYY